MKDLGNIQIQKYIIAREMRAYTEDECARNA